MTRSVTGDALPLWELRDITKRYPGVTANDGINLKLFSGEIHGLLGENGCGKSTLIKILSGVEQPTQGQIFRTGAPIVLRSPVEARLAGIATVFQEFSLVPELTVAENIFLGRAPLKKTAGTRRLANRRSSCSIAGVYARGAELCRRRIGSSLQAVIIGAIILTAVGLDMWRGELGKLVAIRN